MTMIQTSPLSTQSLTSEEYHFEEPATLFIDDDPEASPASDPIEWPALEDFAETEFTAIGITSDDSPTPGDYSDGNSNQG